MNKDENIDPLGILDNLNNTPTDKKQVSLLSKEDIENGGLVSEDDLFEEGSIVNKLRMKDKELAILPVEKKTQINPLDIGLQNMGEAQQLAFAREKVTKKFDEYSYGLNGLVPKDSAEAKGVAMAAEMINSGAVPLPTDEKSMKKLDETMKDIAKTAYGIVDDGEIPPPISTDKNSHRTTKKQSNDLPDITFDSDDVMEEVPAAQPRSTADLIKAKKGIERVGEISSSNNDSRPVIQINVDTKEAVNLISKIPSDKKIEVNDKIIVNRVTAKDIPVIRRKIDKLSDYKELIKSRTNAETAECPLANSGYVATFKALGSLAMSTLEPDNIDDPMSQFLEYYPKRYKFCYSALVSTSIGDLSFEEFKLHTSYLDIPMMIYTITKASYPDEGSIVVPCGNPILDEYDKITGYCDTPLSFDYKLSGLIDKDSIDTDTYNECNDIIYVKDQPDEAGRVHEESPVRTEYDCKLNDTTYISIKNPDGMQIIERFKYFRAISDKYNRSVAQLCLFISRIVKLVQTKEDSEPEAYEITRTDIIADELYNLKDDEFLSLSTLINDLKEFKTPRFRLNGEAKCPRCGSIKRNPIVDIDDMVFLLLRGFQAV